MNVMHLSVYVRECINATVVMCYVVVPEATIQTNPNPDPKQVLSAFNMKYTKTLMDTFGPQCISPKKQRSCTQLETAPGTGE